MSANTRRIVGPLGATIAGLVIYALLASVLLATPAATAAPSLLHGVGYAAPTIGTAWVGSDRVSVYFGMLDPSIAPNSTVDWIDRRYDKGLRAAPENRPSKRFVWRSRFDDENGANVSGNALHDLCVKGQLGSPAVWDCWPNPTEIADAGATGDSRVLAYYQTLPTDPAQAVPIPLPGKPCGVSVQTIPLVGLRLVMNTSPLCLPVGSTQPSTPTTPTTPTVPVPPITAPTIPIVPAASCVAWSTQLMGLLAKVPQGCGATVPGLPPGSVLYRPGTASTGALQVVVVP